MTEKLREALVQTNAGLGYPLHTEPTEDERDTWQLFADALSQRLALLLDSHAAKERLAEFDLIKRERPLDPTYWDMHHRAALEKAVNG